MKAVIAGVGALVLGLAVGSFVSGNGVKKELLAEAARIAADSASAAAQHAEHPGETTPDAAGREDPPTGGTEHTAEEHAASDETAVMAASTEVPASRAEPAPPAPVVPDPDSVAEERARMVEEGAQKLSQIFGAMQAQDAANVLQEMEDQEIEMILRHMNDRLAAQILGVFEPSRAASLSRAVLGLAGEGG